MRTIEHMGVTVSYNERCLRNWRWQKAIASGDNARGTRAIERLLDGRDDYYAYALSTDDPIGIEEWLALGEDAQDDLLDGVEDPGPAMNALLGAIMEDAGQAAKN